eukprot:m.211779 g.211779  ORF g.211779 m.211779 type:complete len:196 (+) comp15842_c0_seq10:1941-2528(+)
MSILNSSCCYKIPAPEKCHRYLIGMKGAAIKQIQSKSDACVFFPNTKNTPEQAKPSCKDAITIVGQPQACEKAKELLYARLRNCRLYANNGSTQPNSAYRMPAKNEREDGDNDGFNKNNEENTDDTEMQRKAEGKFMDPFSPESLQACATALHSAGMAWSRSAMTAAGFRNAEPSRMIYACTGAKVAKLVTSTCK